MKFGFPRLAIGTDDARRGERLITVVHHHWFTLLKEVVGVGILFVIPFIALPLVGSFVSQSGQLSIPASDIGAMLGFFGSLWALLCWQLLFARWTDFYFDVWIITNWRIIDFDLQGLFRIDITTLMDLDHIQDINTKSNGVIQNILNFGEIEIQTAGTKREFLFEEIPNPRNIERLIRSAQEELLGLKAAAGVTHHP